MKTSISSKLVAAGVVAALAVPLSASARHCHSEDIIAGVVIGCVAGAVLASAADGGCVYMAPSPPPPPPPPQYYAPPPPPQYYVYPSPPPGYYGYPQPQPRFHACHPRRGLRY